MKRRSVSSIVVAAIVVFVGVSPALATDPPAEVVLPDGRTLPPPPEGVREEPSIQGQMLAENPEAPATALSEVAAPEGVGTITGDVSGLIAGGETAANGPAGPLPNGLRKEVLGFLPHWMLSEIGSLRYDLVSTIAYFGIPANADGTLNRGSLWTAWNSAAMTSVINNAHSRGVRVVPTITLMSWNGDYTALSTLLNSDFNRSRLVNEIARAVRDRGVDGVNIDFEPVPTSLRSQFTTFIREMKFGLINSGVGSYLTVDTMAGAASWSTGYDVVGLTADGAADALMVMAYDFSWSGSARAGGVAPMESPYIFDVTDALADHLELVPPHKIIWGVPYYGRSWATQTDQLNSLTQAQTAGRDSRAWGYTVAIEAAAQYGRRWDATGQVPWFVYWDASNDTHRQGYYDDPASLGAKYDMVNRHGLAGIGIWSLLMDAGSNDLWNVILDRFLRFDRRIWGPDRYTTAAALSATVYAPGVPVAYVATGLVFPDALAGGVAAGRSGGPVLLVRPDAIPAATHTELARLRPGRIVVLGGPGSVSDEVFYGLGSYTGGGVSRLWGHDRYATAAAISAASFAPGAPVAYVASGLVFPDALAGVAPAVRDGGPVLLVRPDAIPAETAAELSRLRPGRIVVLGGPASVGEEVAVGLGSYAPVSRLWGPDRYTTAAAISAGSFASASTVYVATGLVFPDSLAAGPVAGRGPGPVLLVPPTSLPPAVAAELRRLNPAQVVVVGGPGSVSDAVLAAIRAIWQ